MDLRYDTATEGFRVELRAWLEANQPSAEDMRGEPFASSAHMPAWARAWQRRLFDAGWLVPGWPPELGGRDATPVQQLVYFEELARIRASRTYNIQGLTIIAPSIRDYGTPEQVERWVLPTLRAEISWCLGMSEPGAGSDLAALSTRAVDRGDHFEVTGQKIWTSGAQHADLCFCFVRTDPEAAKHRGISVLVIDMKSPGVDARPLPDLLDRASPDFNEVYLDGVVVPRDCLVGPLNQGWSMATGSLAHERGMLWTNQAARLEQQVLEVRALGQRRKGDGTRIGEDARFRDQVASLHVDVQALKFMGYRGFSKFAKGEASPEHSVLKLMGSELEQRLCRIAAEWQGAAALDVAFAGYQIADEPAPWMRQYLRTFSNTIAGGTSEIQRNIIAQRVLGLPRR